jgi:pimeloyl-ACP methyl ester carboxylesterase
MRERPTLVFVHGGPGFDHSYFKPYFAALADDMQVVFYAGISGTSMYGLMT